jgi:hypothetical protein
MLVQKCRVSVALSGLIVAFVTQPASAQTSFTKLLDPNRHGWYAYSGDHPVAGKWGVHFDAQWRRAEVVTRWQQYQLRPGLNYHATPNLLLTLGYAFTRTYPYGEFPVLHAFPEHRMYQQLLLTQHRLGITFQHRARLEQRWIRYANAPPSGWTYQNRFRYLSRVEMPLAKQAGQSTFWYLAGFDEVFIGMVPNYGARPFDQNRLFVGLGHSFGKTKMEAGYLNQLLGQRNGRVFEMNHTLVIALTSTVSLSDLFTK